MRKTQLKQIIREIIKECIEEINSQKNMDCDPTKEEMLEFLRRQYGNEEGFDFDAEEAIYWFSNHYHGGQWTNLYSALSTSEFSPGPLSRGPDPQSMAKIMYKSLVRQFCKNIKEITTTSAASPVTGKNFISKRKFNEEEQLEPEDPETGEIMPGPRARHENWEAGGEVSKEKK